MVRKVPCEVYSRIVGYMRPTAQWNVGKRREFDDRRVFKLSMDKTAESEQDDEGQTNENKERVS